MKKLLKKLKTLAVAGIAMGLAITPVFAGSIPTGLKDALGGGVVANPVPTPESVASITDESSGTTTYYDSLTNALIAVQNGQTIQMLVASTAETLPACSVYGGPKTFTLQGLTDGDGYTEIAGAAGDATVENVTNTFRNINWTKPFSNRNLFKADFDFCKFTGEGGVVNARASGGATSLTQAVWIFQACKFEQTGATAVQFDEGKNVRVTFQLCNIRGKVCGLTVGYNNDVTFFQCTLDGSVEDSEGKYFAEVTCPAAVNFAYCTFTDKFIAGVTAAKNAGNNGINIPDGSSYMFFDCGSGMAALVGEIGTGSTALISSDVEMAIFADGVTALNQVLTGYEMPTITGMDTLTGRVKYDFSTLTADGWSNGSTNYAATLSGTLTVSTGLTFSVASDATVKENTVIRLAAVQGGEAYNTWLASNLTAEQAANATVAGWVAAIGDTKYYTLADALTAVKADETVELLADITETSFTLKDGITLDTHGYNLNTTSGWTLQNGSVLKGNTITNGTDVTAISNVGTVNGTIYASSGTLDLRGVDLRVKGEPAIFGGTAESPATLGTLKAARVFFGDTYDGGGNQTITNIVLENCTTAYRAALGVYYDTLTVDTVAVNAAEGWYWDQQYQDYNYQMYTGFGGTLVIKKSLTTGEYMNAGYSIGKKGITCLEDGAEINCLDFQNTGDVTEETKAAGTVHVNGTNGTLNAAALNNHAITTLGTVNLTSHPVHTTANGGLFSVNYGTDAVLTIGQLNFLNKAGDATKSQMRAGDNAVATIGGLSSNPEVGVDFYVTQTSDTTVNEDGGNAVQFTGDIVFTTYADASSADTKFTLNLDSSDDYFTGAIRGTTSAGNRWGKWSSAVNGDEVAGTDNIAGMTLTVTNGAVWTMTGDSVVNALTVKGATLSGSGSALLIPAGGTFALDYTAAISLGSIANNGTITVDMAGATEDSYKIVSATAASDYGTVTLVNGNYAAKITGNDLYAVLNAAQVISQDGATTNSYETMVAAFAAVQNEETIRVLKDNDENVTVPPTAEHFYFDANGKQLTGSVTAAEGFSFKPDGKGGCVYARIVYEAMVIRDNGAKTNLFESVSEAWKDARNSSKDAPVLLKLLKSVTLTNTLDSATQAN